MWYFHRRAICRKQKSKIIALKISNGSWCEDVATLMSEVVQFSQNLFKDDGSPSEAFFITSSFPHLSNDALQYLDSIPLCEEIHSALMEMASLKSPDILDFAYAASSSILLMVSYKERLMTYVERCCRSIGQNPSCPCCFESEETIISALHDCQSPREVWMNLIAPDCSAEFFNSNVHDWLRSNMATDYIHLA
ncbi:hypothetical protein V6N12_031548 [Hibiscus sabdariffa]|uniref:Uncharacterized protein n=1 Tax=Hibiscus sabdariffa TaxID=183260 RepID=A0ABR2CPK3_9ROSI